MTIHDLSAMSASKSLAPTTTEHVPERIHVVDSHTEGEPTRVVIAGWPQPRGNSMAEKCAYMLEAQDHLRRAVLLEPRGHSAMVGALVTPPTSPDSVVGVVFFNNAGYLGMCGHGLMGLIATLKEEGKIGSSAVEVDTPVGTVSAQLHRGDSIEITNVPSYCLRKDVEVDVPGLGVVAGDIAYGGNWFYITELRGEVLSLKNLARLLDLSERIKSALRGQGITGSDGAEIDHIELSGSATSRDADSRNFVLCPGGEYDRSPCGTGTSAKLATLYARGQLALNEEYRQESIVGGVFSAVLSERDGKLIPTLRGRAFVTGRTTLHLNPNDPFRLGIPEA